MGVSKSMLFTKEQNELAALAKCLGHPARIAIIQHICSVKGCINSDLVHELGLAQATISQHLRELKKLGLIQGTIEGRSMNYCINPEKWKWMASTFEELFDQFYQDGKLDCC
jgi:predicted transcriptional regulator